MTTKQERLDKLAKVVRRAEDALRNVANEARSEADARCRPDQCSVSADLRDMASDFEQAAAMAGRGYAKGRRLQIPDDGGMITPRFGGGGKG